MFLWGKFLGFIFGYLLAGFWGAVLGCWIGHQFDNAFSRTTDNDAIFNWRSTSEAQIKTIIFEATFTLMGYLAKADGRVSERAIYCAQQVMQQMRLSPSQRRKAINLFKLGKAQDFDLEAMLIKLLRVGQWQPLMLQHFLELQLKVLKAADQHLSANKRKILEYIAQRLGLVFYSSDSQTKDDYYTANESSVAKKSKLAAAYSELEVASTASDQEIKAAYRRLMSRYHPDKLAANGEATALKAATQKTQRIKEAYEQIKAARRGV